jgi:hypothetical protein
VSYEPTVLEVTIALLPLIFIVGGIVIIALNMHHRMKLKALRSQERLAMIEKGLSVPAPEDLFERRVTVRDVDSGIRVARHRTAGVLLIGLGIGLMLLIGVAADSPPAGIGIGGAVATIGAAFLVNSLLAARDVARRVAGGGASDLRRPLDSTRPPEI